MNTSKFGYLLILFVVIGFCTRITTSDSSSDLSIFVKVDKSTIVEIIRGEVKEVKEIDSFKIFKIHFLSVNGGTTYWFGKIKTNETNGDKYLRLSLLENGLVDKQVSLNDILKLTPEIIDTMKVYPLYLIE